MASPIIFSDGFDYSYIDSGTLLPANWDASLGNGTSVLSTRSARSGLQGLEIGGGSQGKLLQKGISSITGMYLSFALNITTAATSNFAQFFDGAGTQCSLQYNGSSFQFFRGNNLGTAIGNVSTVTIGAGSYHYYEIFVTISATLGTTVLRVDGVVVISGVNLNTKGSSSSGITLPTIVGPAAGSWWYDDVVMQDTTGSFLGDVSCLGQVALANGTENDFAQNAQTWVAATVQAVGDQLLDSNGNLQQVVSITSDAKTGASTAPTWPTTPVGATIVDNHVTWKLVAIAPLSNFQFVNEPVADFDDSYLSSATASQQERYTFPAVTAAVVYGVALKPVIRKDDVGTRTYRTVAKSGATIGDNGQDLTLGSSYAQGYTMFDKDPNTGTAWTQTTVNAAEFGIKVIS